MALLHFGDLFNADGEADHTGTCDFLVGKAGRDGKMVRPR